MADMKAFSDEMVKIAGVRSMMGSIPLGLGAGSLIGGISGGYLDRENRARGMAYGAGIGGLAGLGTANMAMRFPEKKYYDAIEQGARKIDTLAGTAELAAARGDVQRFRQIHGIEIPTVVKKIQEAKKRWAAEINQVGLAAGVSSGLTGGMVSGVAADRRRKHSKIKRASDVRNLTPEQKEEFKQFLKNTGVVVGGVGLGTALGTATHLGVEKLFGPKGRWPNKINPIMRKALPVAVPVLGGGSVYLYHQMRKKREDLLREARRRGRRKAASS